MPAAGRASLVLASDELAELTGRRHSDAQERELKALGIPFGHRSDGSLVVLRSVVEHLLGAGAGGGTMHRDEPEVQPCRP